MMPDFFKGQMDYIFFFYGLSFMLLAPICLYLNRDPRRRLPWMWLGLFGAAHGVNELLSLLTLVLGSDPVLNLARLVLATGSFIFLVEFGRAGTLTLRGRGPGRWILAALLGISLWGFFAGLAGFAAVSRYVLGFGGGLWAAGALYFASQATGAGRMALQGAALGMLGYALTNLVVTPAPLFPAAQLNSESFLTMTGLPIQLVKGLLALWISAWLGLLIQASLTQETEPRIRVWVRNLACGAVAGVIILLVGGWLLTQHLGRSALQGIRGEQKHNGELLQSVMLDKMAETDQLAALMSSSRGLVSALATGQPRRVQEANEVLDRYSQAFPQSVCYLMDTKGVTIASSNRRQPDSFVGESYAYRPYFQQAAQGSPGRYWALGVTSKQMGYYASYPVQDRTGKITGVAVFTRPIGEVEGFFTPQTVGFVIDYYGMVIMANRPEMVLNNLWPLAPATQEILISSRQFGPGPFKSILAREPVDRMELLFQGKRLLALRQPFPWEDWSVVILSPMHPVIIGRLMGITVTLLLCFVVIGLMTIIGLTIDSTARLQRTERKYRELYEKLGEGIVAVNLQGTIVEFNPAFQQMLGYSPEELYRLTYLDITPERWSSIAARINEEQVFKRGYSDLYEKEYRRKDGTVFPVELQTYLVRDAAGHPAGLWAFVRDITHRKQIEANVLNEKILADTTIDSLPGIFYLFDQQGRFLRWNENFERATGYSAEEVAGMHPLDLFSGEDKTKVEERIREVFVKGEAAVEADLVSKDGGRTPYIFIGRRVMFDGTPYLIGTGTDISERRRAEDALRDSEQKYRLLVTDVPAMVYKGYADWTVDFFDDKIEELTGYPLEDFTTRRLKWLDLILAEDREGVGEAFKQALKSDRSFVREYRIKGQSGAVQWIRDRGKIVLAQDGSIDYVSGTFADITQQKAMDEALKKERDFISALLETVGALVVVLDPEGRIVRFNHACEFATGYLFDEVRGKQVWDLLLPAAEIEPAKTIFQQLRGGNFPSCFEGYWVGTDGSHRLISWTNTCLLGDDGTVQYVIGTGIDITLRRRTEAALERLRLQNEMILTSAGEGIFGLDQEGNATFINPAALEMTGYESGELLGQKIHEIIHYQKADGTRYPTEECPIYRTIRYGEVQRVVDDLFWTKAGQLLPVEYVTTPIRENGVLVGAVGVFRDITERKAAEEALSKNYRELQETAQQLEQSRNTLQLIIESVPLRVFWKDSDLRYLGCNTLFARDAGLSHPQQLLGKDDFAMGWKEQADLYRTDDRQIMESRRPKINKIEPQTTPTGAAIWLSTSKVPLQMPNGEVFGVLGIYEEITERKLAEEALARLNDNLRGMVAETEERNRQMTLLNEMGDELQACQFSEEAYQVIRNFMPKFFPTLAGGALYMLNNSKNLFQEVVVWGKSLVLEKVFAPDECWALRRGRLHLVNDPVAEMSCRHVPQPLQAGYLCVPLMAQGEAMGILHLQATGLIPSDFKEPTVHIAATLGEGMALALANLKLRETLRSQAIRDPLTGLFNRRYLEETLERELHRVKRLGSSLGVVMMDLDHFKEYNDTHGHEGGDAMLSAVGSLIKTHCREEDIPCRYGGEEFLLILSGASSEVTLGRAEKLRQAVKELQIQHRGQYINPTTMSLGVAVFPDQGATGEDLIRAADNALYLAKAEGRDRVVVATGNAEPGSFYLAQKAFS